MRTRWTGLGLILILLCRGMAPAKEPPAPEEAVLSQVETDAEGHATRAAKQAADAIANDEPLEALSSLATLIDQYPDVIISLHGAGVLLHDPHARGLRWPAARVANRVVATLPDEARQRWHERFRDDLTRLSARVNRGDAQARTLLVRRYGATPAGLRAALLDATLAAERGAWTLAADRYRRWLALSPRREPLPVRARVVASLARVLYQLEDAGARRELVLAHADVLEVPLNEDGDVLLDWLHDWDVQRSTQRTPAPVRQAPDWETPKHVWSVDLTEPLWAQPSEGVTQDVVRAGAWSDGDRWLVVHTGATIRAFDVATGVERWHFPRTERARRHHPSTRFAGHAQPVRSVTLDADRLLVVLGDVPAEGSYLFNGDRVTSDGAAHEHRTRLASLDLETGRLVWATGLAEDTHPLLGDPQVGCVSPPLVSGDSVYAIFGRRVGHEIHAVRMDRETGVPSWSTRIGRGESGRDPNRANQPRLQSQHLLALPWGARPAMYDGALCLMTHAGMAASVEAESGRVQWVRALPRYPYSATGAMASFRVRSGSSGAFGHSARNEPLAFGDAWILAPSDSPHVVSLDRQSGWLRWSRAFWARHLLGVGPDHTGRMRLRFSSEAPRLMDPVEGEVLDAVGHVPWEASPRLFRSDEAVGRPASNADEVLICQGGLLQIAPWVPSEDPEQATQTLVRLESPHGLQGGTVLRAGGYVVVIGDDRLAVFDHTAGITSADSPAARVVQQVRAATAGRNASRLQAVATEFVTLPQVDRTRASPRIADLLRAALAEPETAEDTPDDDTPDDDAPDDDAPDDDAPDRDEPLENAVAPRTAWLRSVAALTAHLAPAERAALRRDLLATLEDLGAHELTYDIARSWLESGDRTAVEVGGRELRRGRTWQRSDLFAAQVLASYDRLDPEMPAVVARATHWRSVFAQAQDNADRLRWIAERGRGTPAAFDACQALAARAQRTSAWSDAAAWLAELRARRAGTPRGDASPEALRAEAATWQLDEAIARAQCGHEIEARNLAEALVRTGPEGLRASDGRTLNTVRRDLQRRFSWHPTDAREATEIDVWRDRDPGKDEIRSVRWLGLHGPGVGRWKNLALLVRGYTPEIWSLETGERTAALHGDEGWFGGTLRGVDDWVPGGGVLVASVVAQEPADRAGIQSEDWVRSWAGEPTQTLSVFMRQVAHAQPGTSVDVDIRRGGRSVLSTFRPGARPAKHGRSVALAPVWVAPDGRAMVPTRAGLWAVTARPPSRAPFWTWNGDGIVVRSEVHADAMYVVVRRRLYPDVLVSVDAHSGREQWRREVEGEIQSVQVTGSAVVAHTVRPRQVAVLDRWDGSERARRRLAEPVYDQYSRNWMDHKVADAATGIVFFATGGARRIRLHLMNVSSGQVTWTGPRMRALTSRLSPDLSMGAFCAAIDSSVSLQILLPDLLGGDPTVLRLGENVLFSDQPQHGRMTNDARLYVRGNRLFIVRVPGGGAQNVNTAVFELDERALRQPVRMGTPRGSGETAAITLQTHLRILGFGRESDRYVVDVTPSFDAISILAARFSDEESLEAGWVHAAPIRGPDVLSETNGSQSLYEASVLSARRHAPVRAGGHVLVPTDRGARVIPVQTAK